MLKTCKSKSFQFNLCILKCFFSLSMLEFTAFAREKKTNDVFFYFFEHFSFNQLEIVETNLKLHRK